MCDQDWDCSFSWRIENYTSCCHESGIELKSPTFKVESLKNSKWYMSIFPRGEDGEDEDYNIFYLCKGNSNQSDETRFIIYKIEILTDDECIFENDCTKCLLDKYEDRFLLLFTRREKLFSRIKNKIVDAFTVRCSMKKHVESKGSSVKCEARTRLITDKCTFEWRLNFTVFEQPQFLKGNIYFFLESILYEASIAIPQDDVVISIRSVMKMPPSSSRITGKVTMLDVKGNEAFSKQDTHVFKSLPEKDIWEIAPLVTKQQLQNNLDKLVEDETIVFMCEFFASRETGWKNTTSFAHVSFVDNLLEMREDFQKLLSSGNLSDTKLQVENQELQVHRSVLAARSPVFSAMFDREMLESRTGVVEIADIDLMTMKYFLKFIYTGLVGDMDFEVASKLLMVANKYQVASLRGKCATYLMSNFDNKNVCEVLVMADLIHHEVLKVASLKFAAEHFLEIFPFPEQSDWIKENVKLFSEILTFLSKNFQVNLKKISDK